LTVFTLLLAAAACSESAPQRDPKVSENPEAMATYDSAMALWSTPSRTAAQSLAATELLERVVDLDPGFALAFANLAEMNAWIHQNWGRTAERAQRTLEAAERGLALAPELPETQAAMGAYYYRVAKDYAPALEYYRKAQELSPDDVAAMRMTGYVARRAGRLDEALEVLEKAQQMNPTQSGAWNLAGTYRMAGRFQEARGAYEEEGQIAPDSRQPPFELAWMDIHERGDLAALRALLAEAEGGYIGNRWWLAMQDGDWEGAIAALEAPGADPFSNSDGITPRSLMRGLAYRRMGNEAKAQAEFEAARAMMEGMVAEEPGDPRTHLALGLALAGLGRKDEAIAAGEHGVALLPPEKDALIGPQGLWWLMEIYAAAGEGEQALATLDRILSGVLPAGGPVLARDPWLYSLADRPRIKELKGSS